MVGKIDEGSSGGQVHLPCQKQQVVVVVMRRDIREFVILAWSIIQVVIYTQWIIWVAIGTLIRVGHMDKAKLWKNCVKISNLKLPQHNATISQKKLYGAYHILY